jgi:1-acyl-sn-glycerol-3-phosphate acyltransferase
MLPGVEGSSRLPSAACVLVANHSSYLDGPVLVAALPGELTFVAKRELAEQFFAGFLLRRLGTLFVERFEHQRSVDDTRALLEAARAGRRLVFFPEGTLSRRPGLVSFHLGAFAIAAQAELPVFPVAIRGTRSILRGEQWFPRRGSVVVAVAPAVAPESASWNETVRLRDAARAEILSRCGEPDLVEAERDEPSRRGVGSAGGRS